MMKYKNIHVVLKNLLGALFTFIGLAYLIRITNDVMQGNTVDVIALVAMPVLIVVGLLVIFTKHVSLWLCALMGTASIGLAAWMPIVVYMNDGNWSIYGERALISHLMLTVFGLYNAIVAILGYRHHLKYRV